MGGTTGSNQKFPSWTAPFTRYTFAGRIPGSPEVEGNPEFGLIGDATAGGSLFPGAQLFGGLPNLLAAAYRGGDFTRQLAADATNFGIGNTGALAQGAMGSVGGVQNIANMIPGAMDASMGYASMLNKFLGSGTGSAPGMTAGRVANAALAAANDVGPNSQLYERASALLRPEIRTAWSSRGLGSSGMSIGDESQQMQQLADSFAMRANQEKNAFLQTAAAGEGTQASENVGLGNINLGYGQLANQRGQLALQASMLPGQILSQMAGVAGAPIDAASAAAGLQGLPLSLVGAGSQIFQQGVNNPLSTASNIYNLTRDPQKALLAALSGTQQTSSSPYYRGIFGVPKS